MNQFFSYILFLVSATAMAQASSLGLCSSYKVQQNEVVFNCEKNAKVAIRVINGSTLKIWKDLEGTFQKNNASFAVLQENLITDFKIEIKEEASAYEFYTETLRVRINKSPFQIQIFDKYQKLLFSDYKTEGFQQIKNELIAKQNLRKDEFIIGLGEKSGTLNRKGNTYTMWNSDRPCYGVYEDPLYKSIPFFMSSYNYGLYVDNTFKTVFDMGETAKDHYSIMAPGGEMIFYFMYGKDYKEIIQQYINLTGKPIMPPKWALGFAQSRGLYTKQDQAIESAMKFREKQIPMDIIYQDIGWTDGLQTFEWRKGNYSNPKAMLQTLAQHNFKMIVSQDPVVSRTSTEQYNEAHQKGYFAKDIRTNTTYEMPWPWGGNCGVVDFTNPEVADWWGAQQQKPIDDGISGFWTDMGEPAWSNEEDTDRLFMKHHLGNHDEIHNVYGFTWDKVVTEQFYKRNPNKRVFQMTRAAFAGLQRYTFGWGGDAGNGNDVVEGWDQFANQIQLGMSAGLGIIPFWTTDISGYCGDIKDYEAFGEFYIRWMQYGAFNPLSRIHHEGDEAVEPWMFNEQIEALSKKAIEQKYQLMPYLYSYARVAHDTGLPIMRALPLEYPKDRTAYGIDHQFLFGKELLVAPVIEKGIDEMEVYLPEGEWFCYHTGEKFKGKKWHNIPVSLENIPVFAKKGAIIPTTEIQQYVDQKPNAMLIIKMYPDDKAVSQFELYEDDGLTRDYEQNTFAKTTFFIEKEGNAWQLGKKQTLEQGFQTPKNREIIYQIKLDKQPKSITINGQKIKKSKKDSINPQTWKFDASQQLVIIKTLDETQAHLVRIH